MLRTSHESVAALVSLILGVLAPAGTAWAAAPPDGSTVEILGAEARPGPGG